jgi:viroplasmin and RNaseH domain-containing protein
MERRELVEQIRRSYEPGRTQDVAQAQRPRPAPSDVERKAEPSAAAVPPADQGFVLTGQTQEELAELERKEKTGEAQREIEEREAKELADRARDIFTLERTRAEPTPVAPPLKPTGDMFGAASQPSPTTAPATPIEEAAKPKYEIKRKESYRGRTTPDIEYQVLKDGKILREHKRKKDAQQYLDMLTLSKEEVEKKYPELIAPKTEPQESKAAAVDVPPVKLTYDEGVALTGPIEGPARADGPNEKISLDDQVLLRKMVVKTINEGIRTGKTREQIVGQIESLTKGGIGNAGMQRINTMLEDALESTVIDPEAVKNTIDVFVSEIRRTTSNFAPAIYDEANNTLTYTENWKTDEKIPREEFDELVAGASKSDTAKGAKYSILVEDTPTKSLILTFQPRGLTPTQKFVDVSMQMEETTLEKPERTYKEEIEFRTKQKKLDDPDTSKKIQEARGVSKPVADAYIRAIKAEIVALVNWTYGKGTEDQFSNAVKETRKIENRIEGIEQRAKGREGKPPTETVTPSEDTYIGINVDGEKLYERRDGSRYRMRMDRADRPNGYPDFGGNLRPTLPDNVKTGSVIESVDLPDNMQVRILKATDGFSVQMYDKDSDNVVDGSVTMFKESVFEDDAFKIAKEYADNLVEEVRKPGLDEFLNVEIDMPGDRQESLFGSISEAKKISEAMEPKGKKLPPGRSPELAAAARAVKAGAMTAEEYNALVDKYRPIPIYAEPLKPATSEQVFDALDIKKREQINPVIPNGTKVGLRLDIPAFNRRGVFVVSIHQARNVVKNPLQKAFAIVNPGDKVSGLTVRTEVPNMSSIGASLENYEVLNGIRVVPTTAFDKEYLDSLRKRGIDKRTSDLSDQIKQSKEINPLIVAIDNQGAYIIEGGHRFDALMTQGRKSVPAKVVIDNDNPPKRTASAPGKVIGYGSVAKAKNVTFGVGNQLKALDIATGEAKDALQTIEGEYINVSPEQALAEAQRAIKDPNYVQIGIDPTRHAYFYDRRTTLPVVSAEEVIQIGNMILAKKPVFGSKSDFLYNIESQDVAGGEQATPDTKEFKELLERLRVEDDAKREVERQEKIAYYAGIRRKEVALQKRVRNYGSTIEIQRELNNLNQLAKELKEDIDLYKSPVYTAEDFLRQARAAVDGVKFPYKEAKISPDVFAVIQAVYMDDPKLLEGLRLSIKPEFKPDEALLRKAFGIPRASGSFTPFQRIVSLYTGTRGVNNPITIRHEITHTLEQMMTPAQRQALLSSYFKAVEKAIKKHKDARSQEFFEKLLEFLDKPNRKNQAALNKVIPSYDFYQYVNPSEYWAVNAEKLMAQRLGTSWDRFKKAVRKMFEKMKQIFGFDNRFVVHQVFDQVMSGSKKRLTRSMLADYIKADGDSFEFLENIEDDADLMRRSGKGDTPMLDLSPTKRIIIRGATNAKESFKEMVENPSEILRMTFNPLVRGVLYLRNKNIWFGTALNEADRIRYNGQVRTSEGIATASLALDNMIRGGNIATQVLFQGGLEFNPKTLMFGAVKRAMSMTNVYKAEAVIKKRLGDQLGTNIIQGYLEAKRSRSIKNEVITRQEEFDVLDEALDNKVAELKALDANPNASEKEIDKVNRELRKLFREHQDAKKDLKTIKTIATDKVSMSEEMIEEFISRDKVHPELREIMDNFNSVNQNMLSFWRQVGLLSENRYKTLSQIKDYVPWYRIMDDEADIHSPLQATTRSATNIGKEKLFGPGKPSVINDFIIEENQNVFKIQPGRVNAIKLEGKKLKPSDYEITSQGEVTLKVPYRPGDVLIIETQREIENMIDNMTRNVMRMTMNGLRHYASQRIVSEYATRDSDGKIMTFGKVDPTKGRFDFIRDGRRTVVEIQDPLLAEAVLGMETVGMKMWKPLAAAANFTRRTITLSPVFQLKQVFKDAPTAALVTGVKRPDLLLGGVYKGFIDAVRDSDPAAGILKSVGIGGFYSPARTPEADVKRQIGIINNSTYDYVLKALDHFGDSSDMAQRIAIYNRVMAETGDEALAMYQAANVINFLRHGSGQVAQALVQTVPFLNAYAQSIDVLYNALVGGGLRGLDRKKAMQRLFVTGSLLAGTTLLYAMLVGDDEDYMKMDDQSKVRSYMIPGTDVVLPMNTSAAFFFKAIPELVYNAIVSQGTENAMDEKRVRRAMKEAAVDLLLGPTPVPSAVKPVIEVSLDYNFFTSRPVVPAGLRDLDAYQQYDMRTSEAAKLLSSLTGGEENRVINPVEADHLIRGIFGTVGGMVAWSSNLIGEASEVRPEMGLKEMPITGAFLRPEVPRGREDLFYDLKSSTDRKFRTFNRLADRDVNEAEAYLEKHPNLIAFYDYTSEMDTQLKELNAVVRFIAETTDRSYTPEIKRKEIQELLNLKQEILEGVEMFRREAYSD